MHSDPLEQTAISLWAFPLLKMSKPTKQRATIVDKYCFCFTHLNLRFPLTRRRACSPFFSFQTLWRWIAETTAKWENDYTGRKKDQNQSGSGSFSAVPEEPGNFLVSLPRWLETQPTGAAGSSWVWWGGWRRMTVGILDKRRGQRAAERGWGSLNVSKYFRQHSYECYVESPNPSNYSLWNELTLYGSLRNRRGAVDSGTQRFLKTLSIKNVLITKK